MNPAHPELFRPIHKSRQTKRLRKYKVVGKSDVTEVNPERIYAAEWLRMQREYGRRQGWSLLELLLQPDDKRKAPWGLTQRDAEVAACVVQWLGTNVGGGFVQRCEQKIDELRKDRDSKIFRPSLLEYRRRQQERAREEAQKQADAERAEYQRILAAAKEEAEAILEQERENHRLLMEAEAERLRLAMEQLRVTQAALDEERSKTRAISLDDDEREMTTRSPEER